MLLKIITISFIVLAFAGCKKEPVMQAAPTQTDGRSGMLEAVNALRQTGCRCGADTLYPAPPYRWNDTLATAADVHAKDMYYQHYFSHIAPDGSSPLQRALQVGYRGSSLLENIGEGYNSLAEVITAWKMSESHCKAMMDPSFREMGAGRANSYWVQEIGKP